ncbi:PREDICTED: uncharacterized protein LOC107193579 [Dufourea novaeangliae]|uniref:uncharacterized protein LOC107193579 n=1 Tax=Dufourea novaeangliae TaxID=178035 RepID=UPI000767D68A|nr:PREDICTED: uncharacterized protein LOC107193579 [Dufourea novaeangliae]
MQAAEMLRGTRDYLRLVFLISLAIGYVHSLPLQILPNIPGYIPVYIRHGDQPLEEINPALAEAFHEGPNLPKAINLANVNGPTDISLEEDETDKNNVEAIRIRQVDNNFSDEEEKMKDLTKKATDVDILKQKSISVPVVKVVPLTKEEEDALAKILTEAKEESKHLSDMHDSNLNISNLKENVPSFNPVVKFDQIVFDELANPNLPPIKEVPQTSMEVDAPVSALIDDKLPIKEQSLPNVLSNVQKVTASPEISVQLERKRTKNQSLEEKSK